MREKRSTKCNNGDDDDDDYGIVMILIILYPFLPGQIYRSLKPGWGSDGYLTREGTIDSADRLEEFLTEVGEREDGIFSERADEEAEFRGRLRKTSKVYTYIHEYMHAHSSTRFEFYLLLAFFFGRRRRDKQGIHTAVHASHFICNFEVN